MLSVYNIHKYATCALLQTSHSIGGVHEYCSGLSISTEVIIFSSSFAMCQSYIGWDRLRFHMETTFGTRKDEMECPLQ